MDRRVAIVGAGYSGMAAAVRLAERGIAVTVFDSGPLPGGRARRVRTRGEDFDNGQHILSGAYAELLRLMRLVGVPSDALLRVPLELAYADGFALRALWLPAPLGLIGGLLAARGLGFAERFAALGFMRALRRSGFRIEPDCTVSELLARHAQRGRAAHYLWRPLCVSALNTPPELASARVFATVLREAFAGADGASDLLLPRTDLTRLFPEPAADYVRARGGELRASNPVRTIEPDLRVDGERYSGVILAVGPHQLEPFAALLGGVPEFAFQPITTCYLQYPRSVKLPFPMLGLAGGLVQWAFDRGALTGERGRIACVISAQGDHQQMEQDELAAACERELGRALRGLPPVEWSQVIAEKRATVACTPARAQLGPQTRVTGLYLAGDYTETEYPPTLEAAVLSGVRAARLVAP